jgi:glucan phosphoethanolaminetransferase (alkaline phosphatase superfamily)
MNWTPVILFYAKTTSWIVFPLVLALLVGKYFLPSFFTVLILVSFGITCFGIYREVKDYKKTLNPPKDGQE